MKKIILLLTLVLTSGLYQVADAQVGINVNIGSQPVWGPSGYDYAQYYYFPDIDVYYDISGQQFIYFNQGAWISSFNLPPYYRNYDLYNSYKVVINEDRPYMRNDYWHSRYYAYRGRAQQNIFTSRDPRYFVIREHPEHDRWMASRSTNDRRFEDNRQGNYGRIDNQRNMDRRYDNRQGYPNMNQRYPEMSRNDRDRNYQRPNEPIRNDRDRIGQNNNGNYGNDNRRSNQIDPRANGNDNRGWNQADQRGSENGRYNGGRRN